MIFNKLAGTISVLVIVVILTIIFIPVITDVANTSGLDPLLLAIVIIGIFILIFAITYRTWKKDDSFWS